MSHIVPTITAGDMKEFQRQLDVVLPFARRVHIDVMDGKFAPTTSVDIDQLYWPSSLKADVHVMYRDPTKYTLILKKIAPSLVIVHAEAEGDFNTFAKTLRSASIKVGVALLPETPVSTIVPALDLIDHVLIFSGNLGHQGGSTADPKLLPKIAELKKRKPSLEIGWDGGVNDRNARAIARAGVDVLNVGGYIHHADNPAHAYRRLTNSI